MLRHPRAIARSPLLRRALLCALIVSLVAAPGPGRVIGAGSTLYVSPTGSDTPNACTSPLTACRTIGHAVGLAPAGSTINLAAGTYLEHLTLDKALTLQGASAAETAIDGTGPVSDSVVTVMTATAVTMDGLTVQNGHTNWDTAGGITNRGTLTLTHSIVRGNISRNRGALLNTGTAVVSSSSVISNSSGSSGITNSQDGTTNTVGMLLVSESTVSNNTGGGITNTGALTVTNSTVSGNTQDSGLSGGIGSLGGVVTVRNSTISNNHGTRGGGIQTGSAVFSIENSTISGNSATASGGGIYISYVTPQNVSLANTILAGNSVAVTGTGPDCAGTLISRGYKLIGDATSCGGFTDAVGGDQVGTASAPLDPRLGPLQDNGGPTWTMALLLGSPAIDAANPTGCTDANGGPLTMDQRSYPRPYPAGGRCDIGAFEAQTVPATTPTNTPTATATATATNTPRPTDTPTNTPQPTATKTAVPTATTTSTPRPTSTATTMPTVRPTATPKPKHRHP